MAKCITNGSLVGYKTSSYEGRSLITYHIFTGDDKNQQTGLYENPQVVKFYAEQPKLANQHLKYGQAIQMEVDIDLSGARKPKVLDIKVV